MTELEKMQRAKMYVDNLANGIDPINGTPVPEADTVNNIRISRCLFYVSDILRQIIDNKGVIGKAKTRKMPFFLSAEDVEKFPVSDTPISISEITRRLNDLADLNVYKKLKHSDITGWLINDWGIRSEKPAGRKINQKADCAGNRTRHFNRKANRPKRRIHRRILQQSGSAVYS